MVPSKRRGPVRVRVVLVFALVLSSVIGAPVAGASTAEGSSVAGRSMAAARSPQVVARRPCPDSDFTCITLRVPLDHFGPAGGPGTNVTFALLRASNGHPRGIFVTATGGPGSSGISVADSYTSALDPRIAEEYDIVFFDQRGIGLSGPIQCPDDLITELLLEGTLPARETICEPMRPDPYLPLPAASLTDDLGALDAMVATDDEINYSPDYWAWDGVDPLSVGCLNGGRMTYVPTNVGYRVQLRRCELTDGLPLSGNAVIDDVEGTFRLVVESPGGTSLRYLRDADGAVTVTGRWRGERVAESG